MKKKLIVVEVDSRMQYKCIKDLQESLTADIVIGVNYETGKCRYMKHRNSLNTRNVMNGSIFYVSMLDDEIRFSVTDLAWIKTSVN